MANKFDVPCCCCYDFSSKLGQHIADDDDDLPCGVHCCVCCCNCIANSANFVITTIINLILFVCVASFLVWIMLRSNSVKFQVHDAQLTRFDLDIENNNNLHHNLSLNFSIRNSNSHIGIHYDRFEAIVYYNDQRLSAVSVPSFYQGHKSTTVLETVFHGENLVFLDGGKFEEDQKLGVYGIDVKVMGSSNSTGGFEFQSTKCHLNF